MNKRQRKKALRKERGGARQRHLMGCLLGAGWSTKDARREIYSTWRLKGYTRVFREIGLGMQAKILRILRTPNTLLDRMKEMSPTSQCGDYCDGILRVEVPNENPHG